MSSKEWWQKAYPGGPMVDLPGFPRPLYPPNSPGYSASIDGPDVQAYKRAVSRLGRWPWQTFDDSYSSAFARGKSGGNVKDSGVAGCQRQQKIADTGYIGKTTFNFFRSARIPEGLPHAGETALDAVAQSLLVDAWHIFHGKDAPPAGSSAKARLSLARNQIGYVEGSNNANKYGKWYGMDHQPWCAMFVTWCDLTGARPTSTFLQGSRYAYVPYLLQDARAHRYGLSITTKPVPGDLVVFDWSTDGQPDHIGIFEAWSNPGQFTTVEGNTSVSSNSNGGEVMRRTREPGAGVYFVRVAEPA